MTRPANGSAPHDSSPGATPEWSAGLHPQRRLGREVVDRLVDPLLGGINAGGLDHLSLNVVAPQVAQALVGQRSVTRALRAHEPATSPCRRPSPGRQPRPFFLGLRGGLGRIVEDAVADLQDRGVKSARSRTPSPTCAGSRDRYELETPDGTVLADGVVLGAPGYECARLVVREVPAAAAELGSIPHSSVALVTFAWPKRTPSERPLWEAAFSPRAARAGS